jgi:hypothetical protein
MYMKWLDCLQCLQELLKDREEEVRKAHFKITQLEDSMHERDRLANQLEAGQETVARVTKQMAQMNDEMEQMREQFDAKSRLLEQARSELADRDVKIMKLTSELTDKTAALAQEQRATLGEAMRERFFQFRLP